MILGEEEYVRLWLGYKRTEGMQMDGCDWVGKLTLFSIYEGRVSGTWILGWLGTKISDDEGKASFVAVFRRFRRATTSLR